MSQSRFALLAATLAVCLLLGLGAEAASAQGGKRDRDVKEPTELLREYPFSEGGRLDSRKRSEVPPERAERTAPTAPAAAADDSGDGDSIVLPIVAALGAAGLLVLAVGGRRVARAKPARPEPQPSPAAPPPGSGPRARSYAVVNQKGGVGKTTISLTVGAAAARRGTRVLVVDLDPQASASMVLSPEPRDGPTMADALLKPDSCSLGDTILPTGWGLDLAPSERALRSAEGGLPAGEEGVLARQLDTVDDYDLVLIDCPPSLGVLTTEVLKAVPRALVVTEPTFLALQAIDELLDTLRDLATERNPTLDVAGVVVNRVESTAEHKRGISEVGHVFGPRVLEPHIPKRAVLQEAMRSGVPPQDLPSHYADEVAELFDALAEQLEAAPARRFAPGAS
jgi:chromosome partitioning protein